MCDKNSSYSELLQRDEWRRKRLEILDRDRNKCRNCGNYNHLNDLCLGYIKRQNSKGELLLGWNISGLRKVSIAGLDFDNRTYNNNRCTHYIFIQEQEKIVFKESKDYIVYFTPGSEQRKIVAITEVDKSEALQNTFISDKSTNPYRQKAFFETAIFVQVNGLHIHHTYYQDGKCPWEYPNNSLQTLCWYCHEKLHIETKIPYLDSVGQVVGQLTPCSRCLSIGYFPEFWHVENGICFRCDGKRFDEFLSV